MAADFAGGVLLALADFLTAEMSSIEQVLTEWPHGNISLDMPSITITTSGDANFTPVAPHLRLAGPPNAEGTHSLNQYIAGEYDLTIQIDLWARNKPERQALQQELFSAMHKPEAGLHLTLIDYFNVLCTYWPEGYRNVDSEESAQRQEWRSTFIVDAMAPAIIERLEPIIVIPILTFETPTIIE